MVGKNVVNKGEKTIYNSADEGKDDLQSLSQKLKRPVKSMNPSFNKVLLSFQRIVR